MSSSETCGAILVGGHDRCHRPAGFATDHPGEGHCYGHGGLTAASADDFRNQVEVLGLGGIIATAETLSRDHVEYLRDVSNATLEIIRARYVAMMSDSGRSPKELADLTMALTRIDVALARVAKGGGPVGALSDDEAIALTEAEDAEIARLEELGRKFGAQV